MTESIETPAQKAAARQARLLAKSKERLAKITGAAKGEGRIASDASVGINSSNPKPIISSNPPPPSSLAMDDDPADMDLPSIQSLTPLPKLNNKQTQQQAQLQAMGLGGMGLGGNEGLFGGPPGMMGMGMGGSEGGMGGDMFTQMMASMNSAGAGGGGAAGMSMPGGGFATMPLGGGSTTIRPKTTLDRLFPLVHFIAMISLALYTIFILEPQTKSQLFDSNGVNWSSWAELSGSSSGGPVRNVVSRMMGTGLAEVPLFWMFISVEMLLQTTRLFLVRNEPPPPGIISTVLPILSSFSPKLGFLLTTSIRYLALVSICLNDLAVLIFCLGVAVVYGKYVTGNQAGIKILVEEVVEKVIDTIKDEL